MYISWDNERDLNVLLGRTLQSVTNENGEVIRFITADGDEYVLYHRQDCCESVRVDDICGDLSDLVGFPITQAEAVSNEPEPPAPEYAESFTWTFYKFATNKGSVTIRWLGESNGYYSEGVDFAQVNAGADA